MRRAIDRSSFSEAERIGWLVSFIFWVALSIYLIIFPSWWGIVGTVGIFFVLYWRLRGGHIALTGQAEDDRDLFGVWLGSRDQRAFTALMLRHVVTGRNPLGPRAEHDPWADFREKASRSRST
jgi:hypothetical protein